MPRRTEFVPEYNSIEELAKLAELPPIDNSLNLRMYFRSAITLYKQGETYLQENDLERGYVMFFRVAVLVLEMLPKHRDYKKPEFAKAKEEVKKKCIEAIGKNEETKELLNELYEKKRNSVEQTYEKKKKELSIEERLRALGLKIPDDMPPGALESESESDKKQSDQSSSVSQGTAVAASTTTQSSMPKMPLWQNLKRLQGAQPSIVYNEPARSALAAPAAVSKSTAASTNFSTSAAPKRSVTPPPKASYSDMKRSKSSPSLARKDRPEVPSSPAPATSDPFNAFDSVGGVGSTLRTVIIDYEIIDHFMSVASNNTERNIETCGVLTGILRGNCFEITTLILPHQEGTSDTCYTVKEEELFEYQDANNLITLGWIHTHPTQDCFLSSVDLHTHYSYQAMMNEAIAIVVAPRRRPHFGVFGLSSFGLQVLRGCSLRGFHPHHERGIYGEVEHVHFREGNPKYKIVDFRD